MILYSDYIKDIESKYKFLSIDERKIVDTMLRDMATPTKESKNRFSELMGIAYAMEFKGVPVTPEEFYNSEYYLGGTIEDIYPGLRKDLIEFAKGNYTEAIITGGLGYGKSYWTSLAVLWQVYLLSMMKDPARSLGIATGTKLTIAMLSVNEITAREVMFNEIGLKISGSRYFTEDYSHRQTKKEIRFGTKKGETEIYLVPRANTDNSVIGLTVIAAIVDEINFMKTTKTSKKRSVAKGHKVQTKQEQIYGILVKRIKSRFMSGGKQLGKIYLLSSKLSNDDFTANRIGLSLNSNDIFVRDYNNWQLKEHIKGKHLKDSFFVMVGTGSYQSKILTAKDIEHFDVKTFIHEGGEVIQAPKDVYDVFATDIESAIADYGGRVASSSARFLKDPTKIEFAFTKKLPVPYRKIEKIIKRKDGKLLKIDINNKASDLRINGSESYFYEETYVSKSNRNSFSFVNLCHKKYNPNGSFYYEPKINPDAIRFLHIDASYSNDNLGFAMGHIVKIEYNEVGELVPFVIIDLAVAIEPPLNDEIELEEIRRMVYNLRDVYGFNVSLISMDMVEKATNLQHFRKKGFETQYTSADRSNMPYVLLKGMINEGRIKIHASNILKSELKELEGGGLDKIDHPESGSKDIADAVACVVADLVVHFVLELDKDTKKKKYVQTINNEAAIDVVLSLFDDEDEDEDEESLDAIDELSKLFANDMESLDIIKKLSKREKTELLMQKKGGFFPEYDEKVESDVTVSPFDF